MLPLHCFEAGRLPKLNLPPALFEPMRANECLVPVDPVTQREDQKTGNERHVDKRRTRTVRDGIPSSIP
jgi:hypothetical protein